MDTDALMVVTIAGKTELVFFSKTSQTAAGASESLVHVRRITAPDILGHITINLILANNNEVHSNFDHRFQYLRTTSQQAAHQLLRSELCAIVNNSWRGQPAAHLPQHISRTIFSIPRGRSRRLFQKMPTAAPSLSMCWRQSCSPLSSLLMARLRSTTRLVALRDLKLIFAAGHV